MREEELVRNLRQLRQIKPKKEWAFLAKKQILGLEKEESKGFIGSLGEIFRFKPVFASVLAGLFVFGLFGLSRASLPGGLLYPVKKIAERAERVFVSKDGQPNFQLGLAKKRLEELNRVAKDNQVKRLAPAMKEYETTKAAAEKAVVASIKNKSKKQAIKIIKEAAPALNEINKQEEKTYATLGIDEPKKEAGGKSIDACKSVVGYLIKGTATSTLTDEQSKDLSKVKNYYKMGNYENCKKALEFYLTSSLNPDYGK